MNKNISIAVFIVLTRVLSLSAMEIELTNLSKKSPSLNSYGSLTENTFDMIQNQKQMLSKLMVSNPVHAYFDELHSSLKLDQLRESFSALPEEGKCKAMKAMSTQLLYLHALALCLPPEIVRNHIVYCMLDEEKEAVEQFYDLPVLYAFDLYHEIKMGLADDTMPVGPLYAKSSQVRGLILELQKDPWYYFHSIVSPEKKEEIDAVSEDIKNMYLHDKTILVLPDDEHNECTPKKLCIVALTASSIGLGTFGIFSAFYASLGACCWCGAKWAFSYPILPMNLSMSFAGAGIYSCLLGLCDGCCSLRHHSQEITI